MKLNGLILKLPKNTTSLVKHALLEIFKKKYIVNLVGKDR